VSLIRVGLLFLVIQFGWAAESWPQWRGPGRDGQYRGTAAPWPDTLDGLRQVWRVPLGSSYSGPIVSPKHVFTTETRDKKFERVLAFDRANGSLVWSNSWEGSMSVPFFARANGDWIRSTPALEGGRLFVSGMRDVLVCLDADSGREQWRVDFVKATGSDLPTFGFVASPLIDGDAVFVQAGGGVVRLDAATGRIVWHALKDGGGMNGSAFASPMILQLAGRRQLVVQTRQMLAGLDLDSGKTLWSQTVESFRGMNILTPTAVSSNRIFTSTYGGKTLLFELNASADALTLRPVWETKAQGYMTSPVVVDGHAYWLLRSERFVCYDLATGTEKWMTRESFGKYWSLVARGDRLLALDQRGRLRLVKANPARFESLSERKISEDDTWAHLAVADDQLFIRELNALTVWRWPTATLP
jgi:outer membrane protein assembly factor BamB